MNYGALTCLFCGLAFEQLPFFGCCSRCYKRSEAVRAVVDQAHPQTNAFAAAKREALLAEVSL